jgi:CBS domain-containing membrane protein
MRRELYVRDLMTPDVFTLRETADLATAWDLMDTRHVRHIPVCDADGELLGLLTHRDLMRGALGPTGGLPVSNQRQLLSETTVDSIMQVGVETTDPNARLRDAAQVILDNKFGCLPVLEGRRLVGILTEADFVRFTVEHALVDTDEG